MKKKNLTICNDYLMDIAMLDGCIYEVNAVISVQSGDPILRFLCYKPKSFQITVHKLSSKFKKTMKQTLEL